MATESRAAAWLLGMIAVVAIFLAFSSDDSVPVTTIPGNLDGRKAETVDDQLRGLGFANIMYLSETGGSATVRPEWTVVSVDGAGQTVGLDAWITVRVR
ncbi:hypothetical protein JOF56_001995 [Kibdelosporangium banguiense]|uniref:PASTA domain-containing protein n=1 Tax=Kibdelosporangium banguiense TaxID=1365924 RepID=A0ABS4TB18_9PSEU|nr:hypothetical protein [Kibdelosporangium banguiense]MBP2321610.1 hypothetical protein [Kibdelosporangium banguiense]